MAFIVFTRFLTWTSKIRLESIIKDQTFRCPGQNSQRETQVRSTSEQQEPDAKPKAFPAGSVVATPMLDGKLVGTVFVDRYEIVCIIGEGGMGKVYRARHKLMKRLVAIKVVHPHLVSSAVTLTRFQQEAEAASCLNHPNIVAVHDFGLAPRAYLVMDYLDGVSLADLLENDAHLSLERSLHIFVQICSGLAHAHQHGVVHRDLKPSNIMLIDVDGQTDFVKIVDFGIAKLMLRDMEESKHLTVTGEIFGSPLFMSPEQCRAKSLDGRSDIYSLGCIMYRTLTGIQPIVGLELMECLYNHVNTAPRPFSDNCPELNLPEALEMIVLKCMEKDQEKRFQSMQELKDALESFVQLMAHGSVSLAVDKTKPAKGPKKQSAAPKGNGHPVHFNELTPSEAAEVGRAASSAETSRAASAAEAGRAASAAEAGFAASAVEDSLAASYAESGRAASAVEESLASFAAETVRAAVAAESARAKSAAETVRAAAAAESARAACAAEAGRAAFAAEAGRAASAAEAGLVACAAEAGLAAAAAEAERAASATDPGNKASAAEISLSSSAAQLERYASAVESRRAASAAESARAASATEAGLAASATEAVLAASATEAAYAASAHEAALAASAHEAGLAASAAESVRAASAAESVRAASAAESVRAASAAETCRAAFVAESCRAASAAEAGRAASAVEAVLVASAAESVRAASAAGEARVASDASASPGAEVS
jgi:eukaryotic-like serine/threonine-protein kinase